MFLKPRGFNFASKQVFISCICVHSEKRSVLVTSLLLSLQVVHVEIWNIHRKICIWTNLGTMEITNTFAILNCILFPQVQFLFGKSYPKA